MTKRFLAWMTLILSFTLTASLTNGQSRNLLQNPNADQEAEHWQTMGEATVEMTTDSNLCFVVRNGGYFYQDVTLPKHAAGQYAVLIGRGSSERIDPGGAITGRPYLYGYMMEDGPSSSGRILEYLQGQQMRSSARFRDEWSDMWGVFQVPEGTQKVRFFLNQALSRDLPHNGSAARFDSVGLYLFPKKKEALDFVQQFH
jgi:hypothetical protein